MILENDKDRAARRILEYRTAIAGDQATIDKAQKNIVERLNRIEIMQAFFDGKPIEVRFRNGNGWESWDICKNPLWLWEAYEYRVAINVIVHASCEGKIIEVDGKKYKLTSV